VKPPGYATLEVASGTYFFAGIRRSVRNFAPMEVLDIILALLTLIALEVVLGIDNIIFIGILSDKLPEGQRDKLRKLGIGLAMVMRLALLTVISWVMKLNTDLFVVWGQGFNGK